MTTNDKTARTKPEGCVCRGKPKMPWHLFAIADKRFSHVCSCGREWRWTSATTASLEGAPGNPLTGRRATLT